MQKEIQLCIKHSYWTVDTYVYNMYIEVPMYREICNLDIWISITEEEAENQSA